MGKVKTSKKQKKSLKKSKQMAFVPHKFMDERYLKPEVLKAIMMDSLIEGDIETFKDVLISFIRVQNKSELTKKSKLGRQTIYDLINGKRKFNPTIETLCSLFKAIAA